MQPSQTVLVSVDLPRPGDALGSYVIDRQVGQGGMAVVYEARHRTLGKRVAIKMLLPHHASRPELAQRFQREGEAAAMLEHANAVTVLDGGSDAQGTPYLVLEYLEGEDLGNVLQREGQLTVERAVDVLVPVVAAISVAHDRGIVHRDLKPENVFLARRGRQLVPKVLDFGVSKTAETESLKLTRAESLLGTPHYMSPEQAQGAEHADARTDQFALGVILYECVTGQCPFEGSSLFAVLAAIVSGSLTPPSELVDGLDPAFEVIVMRALNKDPELRYPDLRSFGAALLPLASARVRLSYAAEFSLAEEEVERQAVERISRAPTSRVTLIAPRVSADLAAIANEHPASLDLVTTRSPSTARLPAVVGSALVLAAVASIAVATSDTDSSSEPREPIRSQRERQPSVAPATSAVEANSDADMSRVENIEPPRKPSGLLFEPVEAPELCSSPHDSQSESSR